MSTLTRTFAFRVRPLHRETLDSYTRRILAANVEPATLPGDLIREATRAAIGEAALDWLSILAVKTNRSLHFNADPTGWCRHGRGLGCPDCIALVARRWLCTRCAQGASIEQYPHLDAPVCRRHNRWVGIDTEPHAQHQIGGEHLRAARHFAKLRSAGRLDARLYLTVSAAVMKASNPVLAESDVFPVVVRLIAAVTTSEFIATFFDPATPYADSFAALGHTVEAVLGTASPRTQRALWLYLRPTAAGIRNALEHQRPFEPLSAHEFPAGPNLTGMFTVSRESLQPFATYLSASHDTATTALGHDLGQLAHLVSDRDGRLHEHACAEGHVYMARITRFEHVANQCPACSNMPARIGTDLATRAPRIATELAPELNGGLTAHDVSAASNLRLAWRCPRGHVYQATPANRTINTTRCAVCSNRVVIAGINDFATTHPELAADVHPSEYPTRSPALFAAGSNTNLTWLCQSGHTYKASIVERSLRRGCPTCTRDKAAVAGLTVSETHPEIAAQWHPDRNYGRTPADFTHGSRNLAWWICAAGHEYPQRIERRTAAGNGCPICSKRQLAATINTLDATEPVLTLEWHPTRNKRGPSETMSVDKPFNWKCLAGGHEHMQTVNHRRKSLGCPLCPREARILRPLAS